MWHTAPEYQIIDNAYKTAQAGAVRRRELRSAPAIARRHEADRIVERHADRRRGAHVEHWLNGVKVVEYELWTPDWERRVRESKFKDYATTAARGAATSGCRTTAIRRRSATSRSVSCNSSALSDPDRSR
jgi:hypothetical protein